MYDLVIKNGFVIDGSGRSGRHLNLVIDKGKIVSLESGYGSPAYQTIEAKGMVVCPGFIDFHGHSDLSVLIDREMRPKAMQGVTTEVVGNCGLSVFPSKKETGNLLRTYVKEILGEPGVDWPYSDLRAYIRTLENQGIGINICPLVGHGTLRIYAMGFDSRVPSESELDEMKRLVRLSMTQGAFGLSSGLIYPPGCYAQTTELIELCHEVTAFGGVYTTHMRNESNNLLDSIEETLRVGRTTGVSVNVAHLKAIGRRNWGNVSKALRLMQRSRLKRTGISCDVYPYIAGTTFMSTLLPPWVMEGGLDAAIDRLRCREIRAKIQDAFEQEISEWENFVKLVGWENIRISSIRVEKKREIVGKSFQTVAQILGKDCPDTLFDLLIESHGDGMITVFYGCEEDLKAIMVSALSFFGTDGMTAGDLPHPRAYGTYPRVFAKYVREEKTLTLEEAIHKMTLKPARKLGLADRGQIQVGMNADIVIFDPETIVDLSTYENPRRYPRGLEFVLVNGQSVVAGGQHTEALPGKVLTKPTP